ncbi:MAG: non-hydrolyzing UDP-N-acetylglucosamine 2-epimerase [Cyanobacteriota bacterium]|jgi:UDP-GlcNAc3NAcA epimerase
MQLITVVGARPQFIKAAAVSHAIRATQGSSEPIQERILHTGQHYDVAMSERFFTDLGIAEPTFHLGIGGGNHGAATGRMLEAIEAVLLSERPDAVLVYGDTNSTLAGALASSKLRIPLLHVEAGLRSFNRQQPEEQNRVLTDHLADVCFAPTDRAVANLKHEGIAAARIVRTGDVMTDAARIYGQEAETRAAELLTPLDLPKDPFILATLHRAENTDDPQRLRAVLTALVEAPLPVVLPLHPRTRASIHRHGLEKFLAGLRIHEPLGFLTMVLLERRAALVVTDSGGLQKEAFLQGTPCVTVRHETEWVELLDCGWNQLADPTDRNAMLTVMDQQLGFDRHQDRPALYGDGHAAETIVSWIQKSLPSA